MKLDTLIEGVQNARIITLSSLFMELLPFLIFVIFSCPEHIFESIITENQIRFDTLRDGRQKYCRVQDL